MASGNTLAVFGPNDAILPSSNYPQFVVRNNHLVLAFDTTTGETAYFEGVLPQNYAGGGLTCYLTWMAQSATSGTIGWLVDIERTYDAGSTDLDADSLAGAQTLTAKTVPGSAGIADQGSVAFTSGAQMDSLAVGNTFRLKVTRDVSNDNASGDAQLMAVEIRET